MFGPAVLMMIVIFAFSSADGEESGGTSSAVVEAVLDAVEVVRPLSVQERTIWEERVSFGIRKGAHMGEYAVLAVTLFVPLLIHGMRGKRLLLTCEGICFGYACTDEFHQLFVPGRCGQSRDVLIDSAGALVGIGMCFFVAGVVKRRRKKRENGVG